MEIATLHAQDHLWTCRYWDRVRSDSAEFAHWSDEDVERLLRLIEGGSSLAELSRVLERSEADVERQARFLGVMVPQHEALAVQTRTTDSGKVSATIHYAPLSAAKRRAGIPS